MSLTGRIIPLAKKYITRERYPSSENFWERNRDEALERAKNNDTVRRALFNDDGTRRNGTEALEETLADIVKVDFKSSNVKPYMQSGDNVARIASGAAYTGGIVTLAYAAGAVMGGMALMAAAPIVGLGLTAMTYGGIAGLLADGVDRVHADDVLAGNYKPAEKVEGGVIRKTLGYIKKGAEGTWDLMRGVKGVASNIGTYLRNPSKAVEGIGYKSLAVFGGQLIPGLNAVGGILDMYRGKDKYKEVVTGRILERGIEDLADKIRADSIPGYVPPGAPEERSAQERRTRSPVMYNERLMPIQANPTHDAYYGFQAQQRDKQPAGKLVKLGEVAPRYSTAA